MALFRRSNHEDNSASEKEPAVERPLPPRPAPTKTEAQRSTRSTWIGGPASVEGKITSSEDICVEGSVKGEIHSQGAVTVPEGGSVEATSVHARRVTVHGNVRGNIEAEELAELSGSGSFVGDVTAPHVVVALGAEFDGVIHHQPPDQADRKKTAKG